MAYREGHLADTERFCECSAPRSSGTLSATLEFIWKTKIPLCPFRADRARG